MIIFDRQILRNLKLLGVISEIPKALSRKNYFDIEEKFKNFAESINIPLSRWIYCYGIKKLEKYLNEEA